ncbi:MAG: oxidoreductase [Pseudoruegeria sp.]
MNFSFSAMAATAALIIFPTVGLTNEIHTPTGPVVLTIKGSISKTNVGDAMELDYSMLSSLPSVSFETSTIWTEGVSEFTGIPLAALLDYVDADGHTIKAYAINDYAVQLPIEGLTESYPIVAFQKDNEEMTVRSKGPLWIVYPFDSSADLQTETVYARSIWQLNKLEILD